MIRNDLYLYENDRKATHFCHPMPEPARHAFEAGNASENFLNILHIANAQVKLKTAFVSSFKNLKRPQPVLLLLIGEPIQTLLYPGFPGRTLNGQEYLKQRLDLYTKREN
jgi:hypothetical protein